MSFLLLGEDEIRQTVSLTDAIEAVEKVFIASAEGRMNLPAAFALGLPDVNGSVQVRGTYLEEAPYYVIKVENSFQDNPTINLPVQSEMTMVFDAATGFPAAMLYDHGYLTRIRAGATGAIAAKYLANPELKRVAIIGSGKQAYMQLKMLKLVRDVKNVVVWGRSPMNVDTYARRLIEEYDFNIEIALSVQEAVHNADLIITTTASERPLVKAEWLKPGVHINAVGSNSPTKQELYPAVLDLADVVVTDKLIQSIMMGEIYHALDKCIITEENVQGELGDLIIGKITGRTAPNQITVADLTGRTMQDFALAVLALEKALFLGLGRRIQ
ncbi:hypothetical protein QUF64_08510 [Anaerolineales bacterium HSG6]|nr:hypothetical protein [Anaerolineales bacterium HSG6]MDM8530964.1 hypothetical protein [Anaerolineales bacterium HSG25]